MTTVIYNDVVLRDVETLSFSQEIEYDESKTDVLFSRFKIRVASTLVSVGTVTADTTFGINTSGGQTVVQRMHDVRARLSEARGDFWYLVDNCTTREDKNAGVDVLDQPLLIACGKAFTEEIEEYTVGSETFQRIVQTALYMDPHPFSENSDTPYYGPGDEQIAKSTVLDVNNGPKPVSVNVSKIFGGRAMRVEFEIEICLEICKSDFTDEQPITFGNTVSDTRVLSNRWSIEETKDANWVTTRSLQGTLRVAHSSYWPQAMRYLCVPPLLKGYKRIRQSFVSDPTDLILKWRVDDQQAHAAPVYPCVSFSGTHSESAVGDNGVLLVSEVSLRLQGPPGVDKQQLIGAGGKLFANRIAGILPTVDGSGKRTYTTTLKNVSVIDHLSEPVIQMRVQVQHISAEYKSMAMRVQKMGEPLVSLGTGSESSEESDPYLVDGYDPKIWPVPLAYDSTTPAGIFSNYLQHPCSVWHSVPQGYPIDATEIDTPEIPDTSESGSPDGAERVYPVGEEFAIDHDLPEDTPPVNEAVDLLNYPYTWCELENRYIITKGWSQLPLANTASDADKTALLVRLHGAIAQRVLTMTAVRDGKPPVVPTLAEELTDHNGYREVLDKVDIAMKAPKLMADGYGRRFEAEIEYHYKMEKAPGATDKLRGSSTPTDLFSPDSNWLDLSEHVDSAGHLQWVDGDTVTYPPSEASE